MDTLGWIVEVVFRPKEAMVKIAMIRIMVRRLV